LRDDHERFAAAGAPVLAVAPESVAAVARYESSNAVPYTIVSDADHAVFDAYDVGSRALSLGQRPALFVVDRDGIVRFDSVGTQQWQIPTNDRVLAVLADLAPTA
jgi:thioredoxin-dependent peroxiredoxin